MRQQYHFRSTANGVLIWNVHKLVELSKSLPIVQIPIIEISELDEAFWFDGNDAKPTCRRIAWHAKLINETNLIFPIILSKEGRVMDGMHRVCKALIRGLELIPAVQFSTDPEPDFIDVAPDDLPY